MQLKYRPEIDGLRTVAVVAVIIYHAEIFLGNFQLLKGGFLGVDIFFVISGFLITSIILDELQKTGQFSISSFYERRARRILPALVLVILVSIPFAWHLLLPAQLVDYSYSILSSLAFGSNFYWDATLQQYGAESALIKPFLHTWSLAVEEQYYIIFPLLLIMIYKLEKRHSFTLLATTFFTSLLFAHFFTRYDASFSFYMLPTRFWELLIGSLLAHRLYYYSHPSNHTFIDKVMPILGMCLIIGSLTFVEFDSNHPGFITLLPVIGTAILIWFAHSDDFVTKLLSTKLFVAVGLISYSLYLWHYPIFAFGRILDSTPTWHDKTQWIVLTFILSLTSYHIIEKPFRSRAKVSQYKLIAWLAISTLTIFTAMAYIVKKDGVESRLEYLSTILKQSERIWVEKDGVKCHSGGGGRQPKFPISESCVFNYSPKADYLIALGDSHAASLTEDLRLLSKQNNLNFVQITEAGCSHIEGIDSSPSCKKRAAELIKYLQQYPNSTIIYSSRVPLKLEMQKFVNREGDKENNFKPVDQKVVENLYPERSMSFIKSLNDIKKASKQLVIVYPVPEQGFDVADKLFANIDSINRAKTLPVLSTSYELFKTRVQRSYQTLDKVIGDDVYRIYPENIFCSKKTGKCIVSDKDNIYFATDNHVSPLGARLIVNRIAQSINLRTLE